MQEIVPPSPRENDVEQEAERPPQHLAEVPEAAPTDLARHLWLFIVILGFVALAAIIAIFSRTDSSTGDSQSGNAAAQAPEQKPEPDGEATGGRARPAPTRPRQPMQAVPVPISRPLGQEISFIQASPALLLQPSGMTYRGPRLFDVTKRSERLDLDLLFRIELPARRYADQKRRVVVRDAKEDPYEMAAATELLWPNDRLIVVSYGGEKKAYPIRLMRNLAGVDDEIAGTPYFVCWNECTQIARCLVPRLDGHPVTLADAGILYRGSTMLYDKETASLWDSESGTALTGARTGKTLAALPVRMVTWQHWRLDNRDARVFLPQDAEGILGPPPAAGSEGKERQRRLSFQDIYLQWPSVPFVTKSFTRRDPACRVLPPKAFVLGVKVGEECRAYPLYALFATDTKSKADELAGRKFTVRATSPATGYAEAGEQPLTQDVMLWFAWKELYPQTDVARIGASAAGR